ncbi:MAG: nucleotidyltransferase substrate binding protein [Oscillospiraceae bacterium]|nr:nucleotidyltransferase substrate binding protein [Clostridia bacterium]MBO5640445.1 nucleotidyltransferase substrate binding protein [Oscillospiraceae bacterium]
MKKFDNYQSNLRVLETAKGQDLANEFIVSGIIDKFFVQFELGWKVLKELLTYEGVASAGSGSPREIIKQAYRFYPCIEEDVWLSMLAQRNSLTHIYDAQAARRLMETIIRDYIPAFQKLEDSILRRYGELLETL